MVNREPAKNRSSAVESRLKKHRNVQVTANRERKKSAGVYNQKTLFDYFPSNDIYNSRCCVSYLNSSAAV